MSRKTDTIRAIRQIMEQAINELRDVPDAVFGAIEDYNCEGSSPDGSIGIQLVVSLAGKQNGEEAP